MLIDCSCGQTNRVPGLSSKRMRCGKCGHVFTPQEMVKARHEPAPPKPAGRFDFPGLELDPDLSGELEAFDLGSDQD